MATRLPLTRYLDRIVANYIWPDIVDVRNAVVQVLNTLFTQYCRRVDPAGDCLVAPANPATDFASGGKYVNEVLANAYVSNDFKVALSYPKTDLLVATLKPNVAIPIIGFYIDPTWYSNLVARVNIYRDTNKRNLWKSAYASFSIRLPSYSERYVVMLPEPIIVGPGGDVAIEMEIDSSLDQNTVSRIRIPVVWLPPVVFTSRSLVYAQPVTGSETRS